MLHRAGLLTDDELEQMVGALTELSAEVVAGTFAPIEADEDVHEALERGLLEKLGPLGGKLRAGRSRNDQVATDLRLYLRHHVRALVAELSSLEFALLGLAERYQDVAAPGMTHLQHAQPVLIAHQLLAHAHSIARDVDRLQDWDRRTAVSPLGAGALAGSSLPLDPDAVAAELGFDRRRTTRSTPSATATSRPSSASPRRCSASTSPGWGRRSSSGRRPSSAGRGWTTPGRPGRRSCRRRRTRTSPSWRAGSPAGSSAT